MLRKDCLWFAKSSWFEPQSWTWRSPAFQWFRWEFWRIGRSKCHVCCCLLCTPRCHNSTGWLPLVIPTSKPKSATCQGSDGQRWGRSPCHSNLSIGVTTVDFAWNPLVQIPSMLQGKLRIGAGESAAFDEAWSYRRVPALCSNPALYKGLAGSCRFQRAPSCHPFRAFLNSQQSWKDKQQMSPLLMMSPIEGRLRLHCSLVSFVVPSSFFTAWLSWKGAVLTKRWVVVEYF